MGFTSNIVKGMYIFYNNEPHLVIEKEFYSPGKGAAFNRTRLKSLKTGKIIAHVFKSNEKVDEIDVETKTMQFLYVDGNDAVLMDPQTYEQISVSLDLIDHGTDYLHPDAKYVTVNYEGEVLSVQLPAKITLEIVDTTSATKGNTATNATKEAKLETGAVTQVPLFIKQGEKVVISTEAGTYFSKAE